MGRWREDEERRRIERLNADYIHYIDRNRVEELVGLFSPDAYYTHGTRESRGHDALRRLFRLRLADEPRVTRHLQTGLRIDFTSADAADGASACLVFAANGTPPFQTVAPSLVADFTDTYERTGDGRWLIRTRRIDRIFEAPGGKPFGQSDSLRRRPQNRTQGRR